MEKILKCRRSVVTLVGIVCLTALGLIVKTDIAGIALAISGCVASVCAANAYQGAKPEQAKPEQAKPDKPTD